MVAFLMPPQRVVLAMKLNAGLHSSVMSATIWCLVLYVVVSRVPALAEYADEQYLSVRSSPLLHVQAESIWQTLQRLVDLKRRLTNGEEIELPIVAVTCKGKSYLGRVFDLQSSSSKDPTVLMETKESETTRSGSRLAFIRVSEIESVEIRDAWTNLVQSTMGYGSFANMAAPTKIDLKRKMANFSTWLTEKAGKQITYTMDLAGVSVEGGPLREIANVMNETTGELSELLRTSPDAQRIRRELKGVTFVVEKQADARYANGVLTIAINLALPEDPSRREFGSRIRRLLTEPGKAAGN